ncbi:MAG: hypothetical protein K0R17_1010 [Rariglobus sp.]|jgi:hypothetical protein|nr:hypothetical protein [Rariglobus sp.]
MKIIRSLRLIMSAVFFLGVFLGCASAMSAADFGLRVYQAGAQLGLLSPLVLCAVNSPGTLAGTLVLQRALELTFTLFPELKQFGLGFKDVDPMAAGALLGQPVVSRIQALSTVSNFDTAATSYSTTDVPGILSNFRQIYHKFTVGEINATNRALIDEAAYPMAVSLAKAIVDNLASLVSRANFGTTVNGQLPTVTVASDWGYANTLLPLMGALDERGVPDNGKRYFLARGTVNQSLLDDPLIVAGINNPMNANAIATGKLPEITSGLRYGKYVGMPNPDGNLLGFAGTPDALMYIARAPRTPDEVFAGAASRVNFVYGIVTDPNSGFSVMVQQWIETNLSCHTRLAWMDGLAVGNPNNLVRLVSGVVAGTAGVASAIKVTNPGYGYRDSTGAYAAPTVSFSGGAGASLAATAAIDAVGAVTGITITNAGTGYTSVPTVILTKPAGGSYEGPASAVAVISGLL